MPFGYSHTIIITIAKWSLKTFFSEILVINEDNVPKDGPVLVLSTHHNMIVDPALLSSTFPHDRYIHYWAKASLFKNKWGAKVLYDAGNIPVNRKSTDKQAMFKGTFDALAVNEVVALFPEGTSYTEPRIVQVKDGASWAALEYSQWIDSEEGRRKNAKPLTVVPVSLVYTDKSKYRSCAVAEYGAPIPLDDLIQEFALSGPDAPKAAVKKLTKTIEENLLRLTINAPDWETLYAGRMAREILWTDIHDLKLDDFVVTSQLLIDLFTYPNSLPSYKGLKEALLKYSALLKASHLTNEAIASLPLPRTLDPSHPTPIPSRLSTLSLLIGSTIACLIRLPFFIVPLFVHLPAYLVGRFAASAVLEEEESVAQNKIIFGLTVLIGSYTFMFWLVWATFWLTPLGAAIGAGTVWLVYQFHARIIDDVYSHAKRLVAAWRVLIGVWGPKRWEMNLTTLKQYTVPVIPKPNQWIDRPVPLLKPTEIASSAEPTPAANTGSGSLAKDQKKKSKRPSSRTLIRHVLRARIVASKMLDKYLSDLEYLSPRIRVSAHIGHPEGQFEEGYLSGMSSAGSTTSDYVDAGKSESSNGASNGEKRAYMEGKEIIRFLRQRGAKIAHERMEGDWAAAGSSEGEDNGALSPSEDVSEVVWVPPVSEKHSI